ncbi:MAG TPA: amidohydrolase, partial [Acidobacteriota bacterium]
MPLPALLPLVWLLLLSAMPSSGAAGAAGTNRRAAVIDTHGPDASGAKPDSDDPWKITDPHGPFQTIRFSTDEGTWITLDVHPDGERLVFALLGDLYLIPIAGGAAQRITSGPAFDVQPRFSPDGQWIAFASDRSGTENLWLCDLEGKQARAVSSEKEALINSPAWSPDGDYLVGVKTWTDSGGFGAELWMWHLRGGAGVQLTKSDSVPQAADPVFGPEGRYLYFSKRAVGFRYDSNVNQGLWQIGRFDRNNGQVMALTGEFGGAAAPALAPDGKRLAFARRVRAQTVLEVLDLASGKTERLASGVTRDNMEGFSSHGVFPAFDWTPDGRAIIASADGKLWRWEVESGARSAVPFSAEVEQRVTEALRFPQRLDQDQVRARILRWPVESPDGKRLVFSAVGHLYAMDLPGGAARRLTELEELEYAPAFSRDGSALAFVTWSDARGGQLWSLPMGGAGAAAPRQLTTVAGQYANPSFSPDGGKIVFLKSSGATFRDGDLGDELWHEIHWISKDGGPTHYVVSTESRGQNRRMARPTFSPDGERIFYLEDEEPSKPREPPKTVLVSVNLSGADRRVHLRWKLAEEAAISPDGRLVVFNELHNAYLTALPIAGKETVEIGLEEGALPVFPLTDEGGEWVAWADGGRTLTWIYGPVYHRLALEQAFPPPPKEEPESDKKKKPELPESDAIEIVLNVPRPKPSGIVAYTGARIVTMRGDEVLERGTLVVENDRIVGIGAADSIAVPAGARTVELGGRTIIPGLIDEHAHLHYATLDIFPERPWRYLANLAYGVTTTHDPSASTQEVFAQAEMVEAGRMLGPRIFSTGFVLYGMDIPAKAVIKSLDDARHHVRRMKSLGAFSVKSYVQRRREQRQWLIQAAREEQVMVMPEGAGDLEMNLSMILDGHTTIEHALPIVPLYKDIATLFGRSGTAYAPTLLVAYGGISGDRWFYQHYDVWQDQKLLRYTPQGVVDRDARIRSIMASEDDWHFDDVAASA